MGPHVHGRKEEKSWRLWWPEKEGRERCSALWFRGITCRRLMPWIREVGLEFVDIIVKSDSEPALTSQGDHPEQSCSKFDEHGDR